jgi:SAM-dependent methyltransferase
MNGKPLSYSQDMQTNDIEIALNEIKKDFGISGKAIKCLEIGPGPRSRLTKGYDDGLFDLRAIDPLADDFKREFGGRDFLLRGRGEEIAELFKPNSIHMIYASNSIDHGDNPEQTFKGINTVLKPNGILIVCGDIKVADCNKWLGLHQHNLWMENSNLLWQNKQMRNKNESKIVVNHEEYLCLTQYSTVLDIDGTKVPWFLGMWKKF